VQEVTTIAQWLREQPHDRSITMRCLDAPSLDESQPTHPSWSPCIDISASSLVNGRKAAVLVRVADFVFDDPQHLAKLVVQEIEAGLEMLPRGGD
jgi:hypothetical protein